MSYLQQSFKRVLNILCIIVVMLLASCASNEIVIPAALNSFVGEIAGTSFEATDVSASQDSSLYSITGTINNEAAFQLFIRDNSLTEHDISTEVDEIIDTIRVLSELILSDTSLIDSVTVIIDSLTSNSTLNTIIPTNTCYLFYYVNGFLYFSTAGNVTFTAFDESLNRGSGSFDLEITNLAGGVKQIAGTFEDIEFIVQE